MQWIVFANGAVDSKMKERGEEEQSNPADGVTLDTLVVLLTDNKSILPNA